MASRRAQIRQLFQSVPPAQLNGASLDALYAQCESNLAALDAWSTQGNQRAVRQAGTGVVAICAWMAARSLADNARPTAFQHASGLSPAQFNSSEQELAPAIRRITQASSMSSARARSSHSTPQKASNNTQGDDRANAAGAGPSAIATAEAVAQWAQSMKSGGGVSPPKRAFVPGTPSSGRSGQSNGTSLNISSPATPSRSGLRDRSSIKGKTTFDPSPEITPSKPKQISGSVLTPSKVISSSPFRPRAAPASPLKATPVKATRDSAVHTPRSARQPKRDRDQRLFYPVMLGFHLDDKNTLEDGSKWNHEHARKRIRRAVETLEAGGRADEWKEGLPGTLRSVKLA